MRVLIVDDSAFMRKIISEMIAKESGFEVVGTARDGEDGVTKALELKPDLITLDIEMPKKDGLSALREIKARCHAFNPSVLMCSSLTVDGSHETLKALRIGAADFIAKDPTVVGKHDEGFRSELISKLKALSAHRAQFKGTSTHPADTHENQASGKVNFENIDLSRVKAIAVGSSTGGPPALEVVFSKLPADLRVPVIVAQHMPEVFTKSMAMRLNQQCLCDVDLAAQGVMLSTPGIHIAQGGSHIKPTRIAGGKVVTRLVDQVEGAIYRPSVDYLFEHASELWGDSLLAIQLTGMGADGAKGAKLVKERGGQVIAQSGETCVVFGMPKAVIDAGLADAVMSPHEIRDFIAQVGRAEASPTSGHPDTQPPRRRSA